MHEYGKSVSLSENYMIVGAPSSNNYAYIYQLQDDTYTLVRSITEYTSEPQFGISVDITDEYAIVGSNNKAFLFTNNQPINGYARRATLPGTIYQGGSFSGVINEAGADVTVFLKSDE